ncbi:type III-A CRISPR-associated RAMP protein Csm4 [Campylobacter concisus]|uniref:type III-A CRISPR-associated RAMP protein Csm4 n=1 Tax=Campylobacter concisus TaxID=199 RepID=UPI0011E841D1|nr:RAMP superfamily CRISPR-associated protein [Campylobacter concisus]
MTLYKTTITPKSNFTTPLKGDTLFGQICWAIRYVLGEYRLNELLSDYDKKPFLIVSDGFASGYVSKPCIPSHLLGENLELKKENRKKIWLSMEDLQSGNFKNAKTSYEISYELKKTATIKNSINYLTFTTDDSGKFAPYALMEMKFSKQDIYFLLDDKFELKELEGAFRLISKSGYGKRASIGKGAFEYSTLEKVSVKKSSNAFMTLSPVVIDDENLKEFFYEPFTRFGKHGGGLASTNPFKSPILMADSGSVVVYDEICEREYAGKAISGHSANANTVHQGYSILIATEIKNA